MLGAIAQFENEIRAERQMDGILKAKARGVQFGPQRSLSDEQIVELKKRRKNGELVKHLMADYGISKATF
jgi:DNA invertase Pin-like site-specific DNA recombinase